MQHYQYQNLLIHMVINFLFIIRICIPFEFGYTVTVSSRAILPAIKLFLERAIFTIVHQRITIFQCLLSIWGIGAVYRIAVNLKNYIKFKRALRLEKDAGILNSLDGRNNYQFKIISMIDSPAVVGLIKPVILLPDYQFTEKELAFIFKHELIHISHFDLFVKYFYELLSSIYWWNPIMYLFREQMSQIIELKTDDSVIDSFTNEEKIAYIQTLMKVKEQQNQSIPLAYTSAFCFSKRNELLQRSKNILQKDKRQSSLVGMIVFTALSLYLITSVTFEPHYIPKELQDEVFEITTKNSYLKKNAQGSFDLYVDDVKVGSVNQEQIDGDENISKLTIRNE